MRTSVSNQWSVEEGPAQEGRAQGLRGLQVRARHLRAEPVRERHQTNIYSDSDVDVVVLLNETFTRDASRLVAYQQAAERFDFERASPPSYPWHDFRRDVLASLQRHYGAGAVQETKNALKVDRGNGRLAADVVPAEQRLFGSRAD